MFKRTASSPTESGCAGLSRPVCRKGIVLYTSSILDLVKGTEVEILEEAEKFYTVRSLAELWKVRYPAKEMIQEVAWDAR